MISHEYDFQAPRTLSDALALLDRHGSDAKLLSGGMSLVPVMTLGLLQTDLIISLNHVPDLAYIREEGGNLRIGALTRHVDVAQNELVKRHLPFLAQAAAGIGDVQVRNRGSIGGSIAHADPAADYLPVILAAGARLRIQRQGGERTVEAKDFFKGLMMTALEPNELLSEVLIPKLPAGAGSSYQRLHRVEGNFAIVAAAAVVEPGRSARVGLGGVAPGPVLLDVSSQLRGGVTDAALAAVGEAAFEASADASSDLNGDAEYRREMARVFARRTIRAAAEAAGRA